MLFGKKKKETAVTPQLVSAQRSPTGNMVLPAAVEPYEKELYKGLIFSDCVMQKYEVTDSGKGWTEGSFTLLTHSAVREVTP